MEQETKASAASSPAAYVTAPSSPNERISDTVVSCYSAPVSSRQRRGSNTGLGDENQKTSEVIPSTNLDDFEFETSKKFSGQLSFERSEVAGGDQGHQARRKYWEGGDSHPAMAFADELFLNGLVTPLKLPPRLQCEGSALNSFSQTSPVSSPKSPRMVCRIPFARRSSWNDDFDPFVVALEKVREENRGRNSHHGRSRSCSPFRAITKCSDDSADYFNQVVPKGDDKPTLPVQIPSPSHSGPLDFKGSAYARWVRDQTGGGLSPKNPRGFIFGKRVRPLKIEQVGPDKPRKYAMKTCGNGWESKVQKLKGLLLRYASFGRGNGGVEQAKTGSEARKPSYFSRLSFKFKGNERCSGKKTTPADANMAVVEYKPSPALCFGNEIGSPAKAN